MAKKEQNVQNALAAVNSLTADERASFVNILNRLQVDSSDDQKFTNVTKAMQAAGWNPLKRAVAGSRAALRNRMEGTKGTNSPMAARALRLFGQDKTAMWIDRFFGSMPKQKVRNLGKEEKAEITSGTAQQETESGSLKSVHTKLNHIYGIVSDTQESVNDIKAIIMPREVTAGGARGTSAEGKTKQVFYDPLGPEGGKFTTRSETGLLSKAPKEFTASAQAKVAFQAAKQAIEIQKKDQAREEYRKKFGYKDVEEKFKEESPLEKIEERLDGIEEKLDDKNKKKGSLFDMILMGLMGIKKWFLDKFGWIKPILTGVKAFAKAAFLMGKAVWNFVKGPIKFVLNGIKTAASFIIDNILKPLWNAIARSPLGKVLGISELVAGGAAVAVTAAGAAAIDQGMKQGADKAIDGVLTDVTKNIDKSGFKDQYSEDQKYDMYKQAMDKSMESEDAKKEGRSEYRKQQWLNSEGLSDEEKAMARRYFYEKEGGAKGPSTRGGRRGRRDTVPAEEVAAGSDTIDTNYPTATPVSSSSTGTLSKPSAPPPTPAPTGTLSATGSDYDKRLAQLAEVVASGESRGDYNIYNKGTIGKNAGKIGRTDFSKMTIAEYLRRGSLGKDDPDKIFAMGKYQIIPDTMRGIVKAMGLNPDTTFLTPEIQDAMFKHIIERKPAVKNYLLGKSTDQNAAILALAKEWASIGVPEDTMRGDKLIKKGTSYYSGEGGNKAHTSAESVASAMGTPVASDSGTMLASTKPAPTVSGAEMDKENRKLESSKDAPVRVASAAPVVVNNANVSSSAPKRPMAKADTMSRDDSFVRTASKNTIHPSLA